jgi:hypothetical protein
MTRQAPAGRQRAPAKWIRPLSARGHRLFHVKLCTNGPEEDPTTSRSPQTHTSNPPIHIANFPAPFRSPLRAPCAFAPTPRKAIPPAHNFPAHGASPTPATVDLDDPSCLQQGSFPPSTRPRRCPPTAPVLSLAMDQQHVPHFIHVCSLRQTTSPPFVRSPRSTWNNSSRPPGKLQICTRSCRTRP